MGDAFGVVAMVDGVILDVETVEFDRIDDLDDCTVD